MSVIVRKRNFSLSKTKHVNKLPALLFVSSSLEELSSTISHLENPHTTDSILSCLNQTGFSTPQIDRMFKKSPRILNVKPKILEAKIKIFHDNGFSTSDTVDIIYKHPLILKLCSEDGIKTSISALKFVFGSTEAVFRALKRLYWFLNHDLDKTMIPNLEYLMNRSGLSCAEVANHMIKYPSTFLLCPETLVEGMKRVDEMRLEWSPKMYLSAVGVVCSLSPATLELKKNNFLGLGFSDREVLTMFNRCPSVFTCSEKKIKENMEVLLSSGRTDRSLLASKNTELLLYSLEKRIKPRLKVVDALEGKGLLLKKLSLSSDMTMSNKKFLERYVISNLEALGITKHPQILKVIPEVLKSKLQMFHDYGFSTLDTIEILSKSPWILLQCSGNRIGTSISALKSVMGSTEAVSKTLKRLSWFLKGNMEKTMIPNIDYLMKRCQLSCSEVADLMISHPMIFLTRPEALVDSVRRVDEMGLEWSPKMYLYAINVVCSLSPANFEFKKSLFLGLGFSDRDVLTMFNRCPKVFYCSEKRLKDTVEALLRSGRADWSSLATKDTVFLMYSLEKRIKPRLEVAEALEKRGLLSKKLNLSSIIPMTNKKFLESYVLSYSNALGRDFVTSITNRLGGID